jgi:hypothetical protein
MFSPGTVRIVESEVFGTSLPDALKATKARLRTTKKTYQTRWWLGVFCILVAAILSFIPQVTPQPIRFDLFGYSAEIPVLLEFTLPVYTVLFGVAVFIGAAVSRVELISVRKDAEELAFQIDLDRDDIRPEAKRAERKLWQHKRQLRSYYDLHLKQNVAFFALGISVIVFGLLVAAATVYLIVFVASARDAKVIVAGVGGAIFMLLGYVTATYVKMHASTSLALGNFHSRLIETHRLLLSDLIASRIENSEIREQTLSKIALNLTASPGSDHSPSQNGLLKKGERSEKVRKKADAKAQEGQGMTEKLPQGPLTDQART